ncbi:hypothetical protein GCM10008910_47270 [Faecalicatena orotica]|uniref:Uncharacterized protein n=1 Tax=Faecalicatena orotica TaxID=1544 RepID=A0A2Y9BG29_9FIRM|nr:hypothetical protein [Faecalicatena orotica]PWJ29331.1 hypothetical protein A8806_10668 [Faecalicatena orotica]SSA55785.1 hypothetical protein SAMN05216536_10668 [Faecalicatena orotica]
MKHLRSIVAVVLTLILFSSVLTGCSSSGKTVEFPFTSITWDDTIDDMVELEGTSDNTYDSIYGGTTYAYPKEYLDLKGTVKYMYDGDEKLMCVAWVYSADLSDDLEETYDTIHEKLEKAHGESGYNTENSTNHGSVWYLDEGNIILSAVTTDTQKALQYSYLNPAVSTKEDEE